MDQESGLDLDPKHEKLIYDITSRGLGSRNHPSSNWNHQQRDRNRTPSASRSASPERAPTASGATASGATASARELSGFVPSPLFDGPRPGMCFKLGECGLGFYPDSLAPGASKAAKAALVEAALRQRSRPLLLVLLPFLTCPFSVSHTRPLVFTGGSRRRMRSAGGGRGRRRRRRRRRARRARRTKGSQGGTRTRRGGLLRRMGGG